MNRSHSSQLRRNAAGFRGRWNGVPHGAELFQIAGTGLRFVERLGNEGEIFAAQLAPGRPVVQADPTLGFTAMPIAPGGFDIVADAHLAPAVEIDDRLLGQFRAFGVGRHRERREPESARFQHEVVRHELRRSEILVEQTRRHREHFAGVVESFAAGRIDGEFLGRLDRHAGKVANRQVIFRVRESSRQDDAGISRVLLRLDEQNRLDGADDGIALLQRRLILMVARRHHPFANELDDAVPASEVARDVAVLGETREIQLAPGLLLVVASVAVLLRKRFDLLLKHIGLRRRGDCAEDEQNEMAEKGVPKS